MKTNIRSLPFGSYGKIHILSERDVEGGTKTAATVSAERIGFQNYLNFDILRAKLVAFNFKNVTVEADPEDVAINVRFDIEVNGCIRNLKGLLRSLRKKIQKAATESCKCYAKQKEAQMAEKHLDLQGDLVEEPDFYLEGDERVYEQDDDYENSVCSYCREPLTECTCDD